MMRCSSCGSALARSDCGRTLARWLDAVRTRAGILDLSLLDMRYWPANSGRNPTGPMKPDGTPDMRHSANRG